MSEYIVWKRSSTWTSNNVISTHRTGRKLSDIAWNGKHLVLGLQYGSIEIFSCDDDKWHYYASARKNDNCAKIVGIAWFPTGRRFINGSLDSTIRIWKPGNKPGEYECEVILTGIDLKYTCRIISLNDNCFVTGTLFGSVHVWKRSKDGEWVCASILNEHTNYITCIVSLKNGGFATGSLDKTVRIWNLDDTDTWVCKDILHVGCPYPQVEELSDGRIVTGFRNRGLCIWKFNDDGKWVCDAELNGKFIKWACVLPDGRIFSVEYNGVVKIWTETKSQLWKCNVICRITQKIFSVVSGKDGRVVIGTDTNVFVMEDTKTYDILLDLE